MRTKVYVLVSRSSVTDSFGMDVATLASRFSAMALTVAIGGGYRGVVYHAKDGSHCPSDSVGGHRLDFVTHCSDGEGDTDDVDCRQVGR